MITIKKLLIITGILFISVFAFLSRNFPPPVAAKTEVCFCHNIKHNPITICTDNHGLIDGHSKHVRKGDDSLGSCVIPTPTPTSVPTPTPVKECEEDCQPEPTDTPTPIRTPEQPAPQPCNGCGQVPSAPMCPNSDVTIAPINFHILRNGSVAIAKWVPTAGDQVNLYYKEVGQTNWVHAVRDSANNGYLTVTDLNPSAGYTFGLQQKVGCGGGEILMAIVVDPPTSSWRTFTVSEWTWL